MSFPASPENFFAPIMSADDWGGPMAPHEALQQFGLPEHTQALRMVASGLSYAVDAICSSGRPRWTLRCNDGETVPLAVTALGVARLVIDERTVVPEEEADDVPLGQSDAIFSVIEARMNKEVCYKGDGARKVERQDDGSVMITTRNVEYATAHEGRLLAVSSEHIERATERQLLARPANMVVGQIYRGESNLWRMSAAAILVSGGPPMQRRGE